MNPEMESAIRHNIKVNRKAKPGDYLAGALLSVVIGAWTFAFLSIADVVLGWF